MMSNKEVKLKFPHAGGITERERCAIPVQQANLYQKYTYISFDTSDHSLGGLYQ